jgi:uncharacterized protein (DUF1800 family)
MNFAVTLTEGRMRGVRAPTIAHDGSVDGAGDEIAAQVLAGDVSASTRATVAKASRPAQAVALLLGSPEFQRR